MSPKETEEANADANANANAKGEAKAKVNDNPFASIALPAWKAAGLAVLSGVLYWAAFPGIDVWPFAFVCWAPLIVAMHGQTPRRALWLGLLQGLTCNLLGFYWLLDMLKTFSGFPTALNALFMVILCAYQGGRMALLGWLFGRAQRKGWATAPVFVLAFIGHEMLYPLLFPWYTGAQTHKVPILMQAAELGGPIAIGVLLAGGSIALAEPFLAKMEGRAWNRRLVGIALAAPLFLALYGAIRLPMVDRAMAAAPKARVGLVQGNQPLMGQGAHRDAATVHRVLTDALEKKEGKLDLVVWSETAINFVIPDELIGPTFQRIVMKGPPGQEDQSIDTPVLSGVILRRGGKMFERKSGKLYNSAALIHPDGRVEGIYDKTYLLAFGEYIPFGDVFPQLYEISKNSGQLTPGTSLEPIKFGEHKITALICYEDILPTFTNKIVRYGDPDLLVNATNDTWFGKSTEPAIHLALAKFRAVEHRRFLIRATNSGVSAFIDAAGRSFEETPLFEEAARAHDVRWMRSRTPYEIWGDIPWWLASLAVVALGFVQRRERASAPAV